MEASLHPVSDTKTDEDDEINLTFPCVFGLTVRHSIIIYVDIFLRTKFSWVF